MCWTRTGDLVRYGVGLAILCGCMLWLNPQAVRADDPTQTVLDPEARDFFESKIRPVLVEHCYACHSAESPSIKGGLRLDSRDGMLAGGDYGPAVVPGDPEASLIIEALRYEGLEMPPSGQLDARIAEDFVRWIAQGAADPRGLDDSSLAEPTNGALDSSEWSPTASEHWAFQRPVGRILPEVVDPNWARGPIDRFVQAQLDEVGLDPNREADRRPWIRRLSFDLTGLPPTPEEVEAFVTDPRPDAAERLVDRLLASPQHGERWARPWLDLARYAEDQAHIVGNNRSLFYPNAPLYRDWVIRAINDDLPYDDFLRRQLANDLIVEGDAIAPDPEADIALGFLGLGPKYYRRNTPEVMADEWEDRVDVVTRGLMGLTVACARCHDHKFDPIPTDDYYALAGVFASTSMFNQPLDSEVETNDDGQAKSPDDARHVVRDAEARDLPVFVRGQVNRPGSIVPRRFLSILSDGTPKPFTRGSGRLELAEAIVDPDNPLTARVIVNRTWAEFWATPLIPTPSNLGTLGEPPANPELLDHLAIRLIEDGWSLKRLKRSLVLSATYRQSSALSEHQQDLDPANTRYGRADRRRLPVESWRDAILAASGRLATRIGGPSIDPSDPQERRRTLYSQVSRLDLNAMLARFDFPDPNAHSAGRAQTTTPLQKLFVLNSPFMIHQAEALARRLEAEVGPDPDDRIQRAYRILFGRSANPVELRIGRHYLGLGADSSTESSTRRWIEYAQALLACNEMMYLD